MRRLVIILCILMSLAAMACAPFGGGDKVRAYATAEEAVRQFVTGGANVAPQIVQSFRVHSTRPTDDGAVVIYSKVDPEYPGIKFVKYMFTKRVPQGWITTQGGGFGRAQEGTGQLVEHDVMVHSGGSGINSLGPYVIVYGLVLEPNKVAAVEAEFDTGEVVRDKAVGGVFALIGEGASRATEIRVLDKNGNQLQDLTP